MGRRVISALIVILFIASVHTNTIFAASNSSKVKVSVELRSIECVENNHVGNEWGFGCTVNKKELAEGDSIEVSTTSSGKLTIVAEAAEYDKYPDIGAKTLTIPVKSLKGNESNTYTVTVRVVENRGRYSGNTAAWKFTFAVKR